MSRTTHPLVIDARPRGPSGPFAGESVLGRPVIDHLLELAETVGGGGAVAIHAREDEHPRLAGLLAGRPSARYRLAIGPPPEDSAILRADRFYDASRLRKALRRGAAPESAVIWRIDRPGGLAGAADEVTRRQSYQPIGRYWALRPATWLARRLAPTAVRPNMITLASGALMLGAAGCIAFGRGWGIERAMPSAAMALALVLDTSDGHLARLQGTASDFGRWLDANLDELGDMALHTAAAWSAYARSGWAGWLVVGMAYGMAKYLFAFGTQGSTAGSTPTTPAVVSRPSPLRRLAHLAGHADLRWHLWIVLAMVGRMDVALIAYTAYFGVRVLGGAYRKARGGLCHAA